MTRAQLLTAGFSPTVIQRRIDSGGLIRVHPGIYLVGHQAVHPLAYEAAALLACRPNALLSHLTAARLWELPVPDGGPIHVTVVGRWRRSLSGVQVHSLQSLERTELRRHEGLSLTSPSLTLLDVAGATGPDVFAGALNEARVQRVVRDRQLAATLDAHPKRRGSKVVRAHLAEERGPKVTRSEAERQALEVMRQHDLEPDESDVRIGPYRVDFLFRRERLIVEVDGFRYHATRRRFVGDRRRAAYLASRNYVVFPLTWDDLYGGRDKAMNELRETRAHRRAVFDSDKQNG